MNRTPFEKAGDFLLGRGFYIVLFLCVATIGFSGYYLIATLTPDISGDTIAPVAASPEITVPDPQPVVVTPQIEVEEPEITTPEPTITEDAIEEIPLPAEAVLETADAVTEPVTTVYTWPVKGEIITEFAIETLAWDATMGDWRTHDGIDIATSLGTSVLSPARGTVLSVYVDDLMGSTVVIQHTDGVISTLSNLTSVPVVAVGDAVEPGTVIGAVGDTAMAESALQPHLHLAMSLDGSAIDPRELLP